MDDRNGKPDRSTAEEAELARRLKALDRRLDQHRAERQPAAPDRASTSGPGMALAVRVATDFVAGVLLGGALGWGFDRLLGTSPWGLMVFLILGFAAGALNALRAAGIVKPGPTGSHDPLDRG